MPGQGSGRSATVTRIIAGLTATGRSDPALRGCPVCGRRRSRL
ncbi:hypothetical protein BN2537_15713 [Streptomyces venezuelae]|nr:hypothetical protein BN2537_15713 [Streptomyces venezuelae]